MNACCQTDYQFQMAQSLGIRRVRLAVFKLIVAMQWANYCSSPLFNYYV
jgi:hypothetical protein